MGVEKALVILSGEIKTPPLSVPARREIGFLIRKQYLISDLKEDGGPREIAIDPIIGSIGIGYKF